jgi:type I restriction enzyme S subunit
MSATAAGYDDTAASNEPWPVLKNWAWAGLDEIGVWGSGGTPASANSDFYGGKIPWYRITDLNDGELPPPEKTITQLGLNSSSAKVVEPPFLLVAMYGASIGKIGLSTIKAATNQAIAWCRPHPEINLRYAFYFLKYRRRQLVDLGQGGAQPNISRSILLDQRIPLPPSAEQGRIVERIDELLGEIAEGGAALDRARSGLNAWRRALLKAAVTGELTRDWRESRSSEDTGQQLLELLQMARREHAGSVRTRRSNRTSVTNAGRLPLLPEGWVWTTLGECISHLTSGSRDWSQYYDRGSAVFVMAQNIRPGRYNHSYVKHVDPPRNDAETIRTVVQENDLLVTIVGANPTLPTGRKKRATSTQT